MAALTISNTQVQDDEFGRRRRRAFSGEAINAGDAVYEDQDQEVWLKASAASALQAGFGTSLGMATSTTSGARQRLTIQLDGDPIVGASAGVSVGRVYVLGTTPGKVYPISDSKITHYRTVFAVGGPNNTLHLVREKTDIQPASALNDSLVKWVMAARVSDNTPQVGATINRLGYEEITFIIQIGTITDADATFVVLLEGSNDSGMSGAVAIADADMVSQLIGTAPELAAGFQFNDDNEVRKLGYAPASTIYQYLRMTITPSVNTAAADFSVYCVLGAGPFTPIVQTAS